MTGGQARGRREAAARAGARPALRRRAPRGRDERRPRARGRSRCATRACGWSSAPTGTRAMRELRAEPGVTVMIWDELCANEKQRLERRGVRARAARAHRDQRGRLRGLRRLRREVVVRLAAPGRDAARPQDARCTRARAATTAPASTATAPRSSRSRRARRRAAALRVAGSPRPLPEPPALDWDGERFELLLVGIGSTGVVTIDALLVRAAEHDGLYAMHLDQTGLAQRGGKVVSHCVLSSEPIVRQPAGRAGPRERAARLRSARRRRTARRCARSTRRARTRWCTSSTCRPAPTSTTPGFEPPELSTS